MLRLQLTLTGKESRRKMRPFGSTWPQPAWANNVVGDGVRGQSLLVSVLTGTRLWTCRDERMSSVGTQVQGCSSVRVLLHVG
eukprot:5222956-Heterocapsa_arctica.AAC.1